MTTRVFCAFVACTLALAVFPPSVRSADPPDKPLTLAALAGKYTREKPDNDWHYGAIEGLERYVSGLPYANGMGSIHSCLLNATFFVE